jgi:hypothetical protein
MFAVAVVFSGSCKVIDPQPFGNCSAPTKTGLTNGECINYSLYNFCQRSTFDPDEGPDEPSLCQVSKCACDPGQTPTSPGGGENH